MSTTTDVRSGMTVFVIVSDFKDIAVFTPSAWRGKTVEDIDIVYYNQPTKGGLVRCQGNIWRFKAKLDRSSKLVITK